MGIPMATLPGTITAMRTEALLTLAQWLSPSYPVGGFAWSHGLEAAVAAGEVANAATLEGWLTDLLRHGAGRNDAILLKAAYEAEPDTLAELADLATALAPSATRRAETCEQGAAFARTTRAAWGLDLPDLPYPIAVGRAARLADLPLEPVAQLYAQSTVSNLIQAALRLMPLGQTAGAEILARLSGTVAEVVGATLPLGLDDLGGCVFAIDTAGMRGQALEPRIFRS